MKLRIITWKTEEVDGEIGKVVGTPITIDTDVTIQQIANAMRELFGNIEGWTSGVRGEEISRFVMSSDDGGHIAFTNMDRYKSRTEDVDHD